MIPDLMEFRLGYHLTLNLSSSRARKWRRVIEHSKFVLFNQHN